MKIYKYTIASVPDKDNLVAEIWDNDLMIAEVDIKSEKRILEIFPHNSSILLCFEGFLSILEKIKLETINDRHWSE